MENKDSSQVRITANKDSLTIFAATKNMEEALIRKDSAATADSRIGENNGSSDLRTTENSDPLTTAATKNMGEALIRNDSAATADSGNAEKNGSSDLRITENNDPLTNAATKNMGETLIRQDSAATADSGNVEKNGSSDLRITENNDPVTNAATKNVGEALIRQNSAATADSGCKRNSGPESLSSCTMQENCSQATKTTTGPTGMIANIVKKQQQVLPFRERNIEEGKRILPPYIKVPPKNIFGYPERYRSPTDAMVSPVSRGLLTRNRRPARTLAPAVPPKALENTFQEVVLQVGPGDSN